jgi:hypothetical protein
MNEIQKVAVEYIAGALHRVSPGELRNVLSKRYFLGTRQVRSIVRSLLTAGELSIPMNTAPVIWKYPFSGR